MIAQRWLTALSSLDVRHPNGRSKVLLTTDGDMLTVALDATIDTRDGVTPMYSPFVIGCVRLDCWPGTRLARQWFAAAFAGYCQHEALELVTFGGLPVLDPHAQPYETNPCNRGLRDGFPPVLTMETLALALGVVMPMADAWALVGAGDDSPIPRRSEGVE